MNYIDADFLRKEIEKRLKNIRDYMTGVGMRYKGPKYFKAQGKESAYDALLNILDSLQQDHPAKRGYKDCNGCEYNQPLKDQIGWQFRGCFGGDYKGKPIAEIELCPLKLANLQEQREVDLEKFTEKMDAWKARYNHPYNIPIKATMAFTARMFYMYPNVARKWYDSLPKVTLD